MTGCLIAHPGACGRRAFQPVCQGALKHAMVPWKRSSSTIEAPPRRFALNLRRTQGAQQDGPASPGEGVRIQSSRGGAPLRRGQIEAHRASITSGLRWRSTVFKRGSRPRRAPRAHRSTEMDVGAGESATAGARPHRAGATQIARASGRRSCADVSSGRPRYGSSAPAPTRRQRLAARSGSSPACSLARCRQSATARSWPCSPRASAGQLLRGISGFRDCARPGRGEKGAARGCRGKIQIAKNTCRRTPGPVRPPAARSSDPRNVKVRNSGANRLPRSATPASPSRPEAHRGENTGPARLKFDGENPPARVPRGTPQLSPHPAKGIHDEFGTRRAARPQRALRGAVTLAERDPSYAWGARRRRSCPGGLALSTGHP